MTDTYYHADFDVTVELKTGSVYTQRVHRKSWYASSLSVDMPSADDVWFDPKDDSTEQQTYPLRIRVSEIIAIQVVQVGEVTTEVKE